MRAWTLAIVGLALLPGAVSAQGNPSNPGDFINNPHATMPWTGVTHPSKGTVGRVIGYVEVPPQQVMVDVYVPGPGSFSGDFQAQVVEIPGYVVTETTTGYLYPPRVGLRQVTPGVYQWVTLPQEFQPR